MSKTISEKEVLKAETVKDFCSEYSDKESKRHARGSMKKYFTFLNVHPDSYIKDIRTMENGQRLKALDQYEKDVSQFRNKLIEDDYAPKTIHNRMVSVKMFLEHHHIDLERTFWKKLKNRGIEKTNEAVTEFKVPTKEDLRKILSYGDIQARAMFLLQSSSGLRIGEVCSLKVKDIDLDYTFPRIKIPGQQTKSRRKARTRCSPEAKQAILDWLGIRDEAFKHRNNITLPEYRLKNDDRLFLCNRDAGIDRWNTLLKRAGEPYIKTDSTTHKTKYLMTSHTLRKYFISQFSKTPIENANDLAKYLANQRTTLDRIYRDWEDDYLDKMYEKGVTYLSVFEKSPALDGLNEEIETLKKQKRDQDQEIFELRKLISEMSDKPILEDQIGNMVLKKLKELQHQ